MKIFTVHSHTLLEKKAPPTLFNQHHSTSSTCFNEFSYQLLVPFKEAFAINIFRSEWRYHHFETTPIFSLLITFILKIGLIFYPFILKLRPGSWKNLHPAKLRLWSAKNLNRTLLYNDTLRKPRPRQPRRFLQLQRMQMNFELNQMKASPSNF